MNKVIFCQTPFQIIVSLFVLEQNKSVGDQFDIVILDTFSGYDNVAEKLKSIKVFDDVIVIKAKKIIQANGLENIGKLFSVICAKKTINQLFDNNIKLYDEMYYWNYDAFIATFRSYQFLMGNKIKNYIFEEGYISYMPIDEVIPKKGMMKIIEIINRFKGIKDVKRENVNGILLFEPDFYLGKESYPKIKLDNCFANDIRFKNIISNIFAAQEIIKEYDKKIIIFEEAMLANSDDVDDFSVIKRIIDFVGKENVIIKLHPRTKVNRFLNMGVKVLGNDGIPWEALVIQGKFNDKILISIGSGSLTNCRLIYGGNISSFMLFKFINTGLLQFDDQYMELWNKIGNPKYGEGLYIPNSEKEFFDLLRKKINGDI